MMKVVLVIYFLIFKIKYFLCFLEGDVNVVHETPRRVLILKTEGSKFVFSDYVFPGEDPQEALYSAGDILNLPVDKIELYDMLEKGKVNIPIYFLLYSLII